MLTPNKSDLALHVNDGSTLDDLWKNWAHAEAKSRVGLALYLHDSLFSSIFHHETLLRHDALKLPNCGSEESYGATTSAEWFRIVTNPTKSRFHNYVELAGILASINEIRHTGITSEAIKKLEQTLTTWRTNNASFLRTPGEDCHCLMVLWYEAYMSLYTDFDAIEMFIGRDGIAAAGEVVDKVEHWYLNNGSMCVAHALQIRNHVELLPTGRELAIHVPRSLFYAGLVVYAYIRNQQTSRLAASSRANEPASGASSIRNAYLTASISETTAQSVPAVDIGMVCNIADLLQRIGHWELSRRFASILGTLLDDVAHDST
jgi:hypothetical protein